MKHNAHYTTKFDGIKIPVPVVLVDTRTDEIIRVYEQGYDFGFVLSDLYVLLKNKVISVDILGSRLAIFGVAPHRRGFNIIRLGESVRDFIVSVQYAIGKEV